MKLNLKSEELKALYPDPPADYTHTVRRTLMNLDAGGEKPVMKKKLSLSLALIIILICILGVAAIAAMLSPTADIFGWFYGEQIKEELLAGDIAPVGQSFTLGDVTYTLEEVIYKKDGDMNGLYGTGIISVAEGEEAVLIPEDYKVDDPAGYLLYYGEDETIPENAPSYADLAREKGCKLILATAIANGVILDGQKVVGDIGFTQLPQPNGTIRFTMEIIHEDLRADSYELSIYISNWEMTLTGEWLREEPNDTWLKEDWIITVTPE